jgi:hypothetical protein
MVLHILEQLMLVGDLAMAFHMVNYLQETVRQSVKVDAARSRGPTEMEVRLGLVTELYPRILPGLHENSPDKLAVVASYYLELVDAAFGREAIGNAPQPHGYSL